MRLVLAHGCFDFLTIGHIRHLQAARRMGDRLLVSITADEFVSKGDDRPIYREWRRLENLRGLMCVDEVTINRHLDAAILIASRRPAIYVKGREYKDNLTPALLLEKAAVEKYGGLLAFTDTDELHTSEVLGSLFPNKNTSWPGS